MPILSASLCAVKCCEAPGSMTELLKFVLDIVHHVSRNDKQFTRAFAWRFNSSLYALNRSVNEFMSSGKTSRQSASVQTVFFRSSSSTHIQPGGSTQSHSPAVTFSQHVGTFEISVLFPSYGDAVVDVENGPRVVDPGRTVVDELVLSVSVSGNGMMLPTPVNMATMMTSSNMYKTTGIVGIH